MSVQTKLIELNPFGGEHDQDSTLFETAMSLPSLLFILGMFGFPILFLFYTSLHVDVLAVVRPARFVGLDNYARVLTGPEFWLYFANTLFFGVVSIGAGLILQLGVALMINTDLPFRRAWQTLIILPWAVPHVITTMLWKLLFNPSFGAINWTLRELGLIAGPINWFSGKWVAFFTIIITDIWIRTPLVVLILLAGLQNIPDDLYEAARIDGAGIWQQFRHVTLPMLRPALITVLVIRIILALRAFDIIYAMTLGGPGDATTVIGMDIYDNLIVFGDVSYAAAEAMILVFIIYVMLALAIWAFPSAKTEEVG
jgi:ABC-type sugar transport system permease subunit